MPNHCVVSLCLYIFWTSGKVEGLLRKAKLLFAFFTGALAWAFQDRLFEMAINPEVLSDFGDSSVMVMDLLC